MLSVAVIMIDGLRQDYVAETRMPLLYEFASTALKGCVVPPVGFEPDDAVFAGLTPQEADAGTQFWLDPKESPFRFLPAALGGLLDRAPSIVGLGTRAVVMGLVRLYSQYKRIRDHPTTARIPLAYLRHFDFVQKRYPFEPEYAPTRSLFHIAMSRGATWSHYGFPREDTRLAAAEAWTARGVGDGPRLLYLHVSDLDAIGHKCGPDSVKMTRVLQRVDRGLVRIIAAIEERLEPVVVVIFGDHGMCNVRKTVDVKRMVSRLSVRPESDYLYFLDSTMARFWFRTEHGRREVMGCLAEVDDLALVDRDARRRFDMEYSHNRFGEVIYLCKEGCVVHPSFYSAGTAPRGMHGYGPEAEGNHGALVVSPRSWAELCGLEVGSRYPMTCVYEVARRALEYGEWKGEWNRRV